MLEPLQLPPLRDALDFVHRPPPDADTELLASGRHPMQRRLAFEELLAHQLSLRLLRREIQRDPGWAFAAGDAQSLVARFADSLPFDLTRAQLRAWQEIERDLTQPSPMLRLVQGDVGCGKTVVAALAAARAVEAGFQAAVMAPTELLAEQHARNFSKWFAAFDLPLTMLTGKRNAAARTRALTDLASGAAQDRDRHARAVPGRRRVRASRPGDRRRAASLRRAPALVVAREGRGVRSLSASAHHDRDADPAHAGNDRVRRSRRFGHRRAAARPHAGARRSR